MATKHLTLQQPEGREIKARGRNGWFRPAEVFVKHLDKTCPFREWEGLIEIQVNSSRYGDHSPIVLRIAQEDAKALAKLLIAE